MPVVSTARMNARQFMVIGEDPPGVRLELVNGEVAVSPRPSLDHSFTLLKLSRIVGQHVDDHDLGQLFTDVDTVFGTYEVRCPDLLFIKKSRIAMLSPKAVEVPPDLCIEIISPSSIVIDREDKFEQYRAAGVPFYWMFDPADRSAECHVLSASGLYELSGKGSGSDHVCFEPFPSLRLNLALLWRTA